MWRALRWVSVLSACAVLVVACHCAPRVPLATETRSPNPVRPDQAATFFPATLDTYGLTLGQADRDHLAELYALRQIDPCGFVDQQTPALRDHKDYSYTYAAVHEMTTWGDQLHVLGGDGCGIAFPANKIGLMLRIWPGDPGLYGKDSTFSPDPSHPGVMKSTTWGKCTLRVALPLTGLAGAPTSMRDPVVQVTPMNVADGRWNSQDTSLCPLVEALATDIAGSVRDKGVPVYARHGTTAAKFLTGDPCSASPELHAVGFIWKDPPPEAQWPTTWRHPGTCNLRLTEADSGPDARAAVVRYGLAVWPDVVPYIVSQDPEHPPARSERDGATLFDITSDSETGCKSFVIAKSNLDIEPATVGAGTPDLPTSTPIVTVELSGPPGSNCGESAQQAALTAIKHAG